jgi:hypothetical protein
MNQGGPGDHPLDDLINWGRHPFPADIEAMILRLREVVPRYLDRVSSTEYFDWAEGRNLDAGRDYLNRLLAEYEADLKKLIGS